MNRKTVNFLKAAEIRKRLKIHALVPETRVFFHSVLLLKKSAERSSKIIAQMTRRIDIARTLHFRKTRKFPFNFCLTHKLFVIFAVQPPFSAAAFHRNRCTFRPAGRYRKKRRIIRITANFFYCRPEIIVKVVCNCVNKLVAERT